ncbi:Uncharacterised protein [Lactiplantibacillus plantarum subsp. plantarum]|nr:Uncharacterised protein [Lactiplantibacillus plantarum subsp. plantarum]
MRKIVPLSVPDCSFLIGLAHGSKVEQPGLKYLLLKIFILTMLNYRCYIAEKSIGLLVSF